MVPTVECHTDAVSFVIIASCVTVSFDPMGVSATHGKVVRYGIVFGDLFAHNTVAGKVIENRFVFQGGSHGRSGTYGSSR